MFHPGAECGTSTFFSCQDLQQHITLTHTQSKRVFRKEKSKITSVTRMHSRRMRTDHALTLFPYLGAGSPIFSNMGDPPEKMGDPPLRKRETHSQRVESSLKRQTPAPRRQTTRGQTDACENITFPHTMYAVGKNRMNL